MECLVQSLPSPRISDWMNLLSARDQWNSIWQPINDSSGFKSGLLAVGHVMAQEDAPVLPEPVDSSAEQRLWAVKQALTENNLMSQIMEDLWNDFPALAACITGETILVMSANLQGVHPHIMKPGFKKFLQMSLQLPASIAFNPELCHQTVNQTALCYVELVNKVKHLELDAGHWHELWEEGEAIGHCIILHYVKHERRARLQELGRIHNINACINSNIMRIRDGLAATPGLVDEVFRLWQERPDIARHLDGNTLQLLVSDFKGDTPGIHQCFTYLCHNLSESWATSGSTENPTAYLYTCVHNFTTNLKGPDQAGRSPGRQKSRTSSSKARAQKAANKRLEIQVPGNLSALQIATHSLLSPTSPHTSIDSLLSPRIMVPGSPQVLVPTTPGNTHLLSPTSSSYNPMPFSPQYLSPTGSSNPMPFSPGYFTPNSPNLFMGGSSPHTPNHHLSQTLHMSGSPQYLGPSSPQTPIQPSPRFPLFPASPSTPIQNLSHTLTLPDSPTAHMVVGTPPTTSQDLLVASLARKSADPLNDAPWSFAGLCA